MMEQSELIPFGEWLPDTGDFDAQGALVVRGCVPFGGKYRPFEGSAETGDAIPTACKGAFAYRDAAGTVTIFAGTATKLYKLSGTSWVDVTRASGGDYTLGADNFWQFTPFGNLVIATSYTDDMQVFDVTSSTDFEQLSATAPRCRYAAVVKNFLVCIDTVDGDGALGFRIRWSPIGDPQGVWGSIAATQTDFQDIYDSVYSNTFVTPYGDFGIIVQGRAIYRMDYVGGDDIFTFNIVQRGRGSIYPRGCVYNGDTIFMRSEDGFYAWTPAGMDAIGHQKIDNYYLENFNSPYYYNLNATIDPIRKLVIWAVPHNNGTGGCNVLYLYSWVDKRWSLIDQETELIFSFFTSTYTLEELDAVSATLEGLPFSLDSAAWTGGKNLLGAFTINHKICLFTDTARAAVFGTAEVRLNAAGRAQLGSVLPMIEGGGGNLSVRLGYRDSIRQEVQYTEYVAENPYTGEADFDLDARYHRAEILIDGDWTIAHGLYIRSKPSSRA